MKKIICKWILIFITGFVLVIFPNYGTAAEIFSSGWERSSTVGCTNSDPGNGFIADIEPTDKTSTGDSGGWNWDSPPYECQKITGANGTYVIGATVTSPVHSGSRSFRQIEPKTNRGGSEVPGGQYYRIVFTTFTPKNELWIRYYIFFSSNYRWVAETDYKSTFVFHSGGHTYNSHYYGSSATVGKLRFFFTGDSNAWFSTNVKLTLGTWHLIEWHLVAGSPGCAEARVNGTLVTWENGSTKLMGALGSMTRFQIDGYNNARNSMVQNNALPGDAFVYYDDVKITDSGGWIGGTDGSLLTSSPSSTTHSNEAEPAPPSNLRIIQ